MVVMFALESLHICLFSEHFSADSALLLIQLLCARYQCRRNCLNLLLGESFLHMPNPLFQLQQLLIAHGVHIRILSLTLLNCKLQLHLL